MPQVRMSYDAIARVCHEANRMAQHIIGEEMSPPWDDAPGWQRDSAIEGVGKIARLEIRTPEQSHESWCAHKRNDGWVYGPVKDETKKTHPCLVPYSDLPSTQRVKDDVFFGLVHQLRGILIETK